ncbi:MAG: lytic murein transglycosylase [Methylotenera sp.]|nr:lytic murein transglycosylase [Methylotenera sp.]
MRLLIICLILFSNVTFANAILLKEDFNTWLIDLKQEALSAGISEKTASATIGHIEILPNIIKLDLAQPEFISPFLDYYQKRVDARKIARGRELLAEHEIVLNQVEAQYGVPKNILLAFWGMETNYGGNQGNVDTLSALATLAYDGRRASFFRNQLLDAMRMIDAGHADVEQFRGSWAGAFGNMQFMPTTFMTYAVDGDGDRRIDIVNSPADAFTSAANYLSQVGWQKGEPAMVEVQLPANFEWQNAQFVLRKPLSEWVELGVKVAQDFDSSTNNRLMATKKSTKKLKTKKSKPRLIQAAYKPIAKLVTALPNTNAQAAIVLPQGWRGPAFMVFDNFDAVMDWNRSINYALSVAQLAKRINDEPPILGGKYAEVGALTFAQMFELQTALNAQGFDAGEPDGFPGKQTQAAIRAYQLEQHLPADGYASPDLLNSLKQTTVVLKTSP